MRYLHLLLLLAVSSLAIAQENPAYGLYGSFGSNVQSADFQQLPGVPSCCPRYEEGGGPGFSLGLLYILPLDMRLAIDLRAGYTSLSGALTTIEETMVLHEGVAAHGEFEHRIDATLASVGIVPSAVYKIGGGVGLRLGLEAGLLIAHDYSSAETITQPDGAGTFIDSNGNDTHSRIRNASSGEIPNPSALQLGVVGAISWRFPLNRRGTLVLAPEASYTLGITSIASDLSWRVNPFRIGASLQFGPEPPAALPAPIADTPFDTLSAPLDAEVRAVGLGATGVELGAVRLVVEEFAATLTTPLLNFIFFEEGESAIPPRYIALTPGSRDTFSTTRINSARKLETYHHLLNIVGRRMRDNPDARITLVGCNQDLRGEKGNTALSLRRAEAVREYLTGTWGIETARISVDARNLPRNAANSLESDGAEENRRVEIMSDHPLMLAPIVTGDTVRTVDPPSVRFRPRTGATAGVERWEIVARQDGKVLRRLAGEGPLPPTIDWRIDGETGSTPRSVGNIDYELTVVDAAGKSTRAAGAIPVEQMTIHRKRIERRDDREIDRSSLILFDIRSSEITEASQAMLPFITSNITPASKVTVTGYTDRLGDEEYNQELSADRAARVARTLGIATASARGLGEADLYDSDLPEGRLYARTVEVVIETEVER